MSNNICMLYSSRNDYNVLEEILYKKSSINFDNVIAFNVDCDSSTENMNVGKEIMKKHNVINLEGGCSSIPMVKCVEMAFDYMDKNNIDSNWLMVNQHDIYFPQENFWSKLDTVLDNNKELFNEKVGTIGFSVRNLPNERDLCYGRGNLLDGMIEREGFLINLPESYTNVEYFVTECSWYVSWLINRRLFRKFIIPDYNFILNFWGDDIAGQFMIHNIFNITIFI